MLYKDPQTNAAKFTELHSELQENLEISWPNLLK